MSVQANNSENRPASKLLPHTISATFLPLSCSRSGPKSAASAVAAAGSTATIPITSASRVNRTAYKQYEDICNDGIDNDCDGLVDDDDPDCPFIPVKYTDKQLAWTERTPLPNDLFDISHASKFVLVDQNGDVRGYWGTDELARGNLINAARMLFKRGPEP